MKTPQTEQEERLALIYEAGWLSGRVLEKTGHFPTVITEAMDREGGLDFRPMSAYEIGEICIAIRDEHPDVGSLP